VDWGQLTLATWPVIEGSFHPTDLLKLSVLRVIGGRFWHSTGPWDLKNLATDRQTVPHRFIQWFGAKELWGAKELGVSHLTDDYIGTCIYYN
jgi:hypothetical protein